MIYVVLMLASSLFSMIKGICLPSILSIEDYGIYAVYSQSISIAIPIVTLGIMESYMLKYGRDFRCDNNQPSDYSRAFCTTILISIGLLFIFYLSFISLTENSLKVYILLFTISSLFQITFFWFVRTLRFRLRPREFSQAMLLRVLFDLLLLAVLRPSVVDDVIKCEIVSFAAASVIVCAISVRSFSWKGILAGKELKKFVKKGVPLSLSVILSSLLLTIDKLFVGYTHGLDLVGEYNLVFLVALPTYAIYNLIYQYYLPKVNKISAIHQSTGEVFAVFRVNVYWWGIFSSMVLMVTYLLSPFLYERVYDYHIDRKALAVVFIGMFFYLNSHFDILFFAKDRANYSLFVNVTALVLEIVMLGFFYICDFSIIYFCLIFTIIRVYVFITGLIIFLRSIRAEKLYIMSSSCS